MTSFPGDEEEDFSLTDSIDTQILMHRDAHFGGKFEFMLEYYDKGGKGVNPEFEIDRIRALAETERQSGQNLSGVMLSGPDAEKVAAARLAYKGFHDLYEAKKPKNSLPVLIADLILSEDDEPTKEIEAIVAQKGAAVPLLIDLLRSAHFSDPLFPGYGYAPALAVQCLGKIGDKRALISLFEAIGEGDFFNEDVILDALKSIGQPAKEFLLKVLHSRPLNYDNERAAIALERFKDDPEVSKTCLEMLTSPEIRKMVPLALYLTLVCEGLTSPDERNTFKSLIDAKDTPRSLQAEMRTIVKSWSA